MIKKLENFSQVNVIARANFLELVSLLVVHSDVDLEFTELSQFKAFLCNDLRSFAFSVSHLHRVGNWVESDDFVVLGHSKILICYLTII